MNGYNCILEEHFFIDHQDSEESEEEVEELTYEELRETEEYKFLSKCMEHIAKNSTVNSTKTFIRGLHTQFLTAKVRPGIGIRNFTGKLENLQAHVNPISKV